MGTLAERATRSLCSKLTAGAIALATLFNVLCTLPAHANLGELTGFGARSASLGGAMGAVLGDPFNAYANPAALAAPSGGRFHFGYHFLFVGQMMSPIGNIVTQNTTYSDTIASGTVSTAYENVLGSAIGASYQAFPEYWNLSLGVVAYLPMLKTAYMDTGSALLPEYILYRSRIQRPQIEMGLGIRPIPFLHLGAGAHIGFALNSTADVYLQSAAGQASSMRFAASLIPKAAPYFAILIAPEGENSRWSAGLQYRFQLISNDNMYLATTAHTFGTLPGLDLNFDAGSALYFDPATIEISGTFEPLEWLRIVGQLDYGFWGTYASAALSITNVSQTGVTLQPSANPAYSTQNIFVPRMGVEMTFEKHHVRAGYSYKPSILASAPTGSANPVDPTVHRLNLGYGYEFSRFLGLQRPWTLDAHIVWQAFVPGQVTKSGSSDLGYSSYSTGGNLVGGGVSVSFAL